MGFIDKFLDNLEDLCDDEIAAWHNSPATETRTLDQYLGFTEEQGKGFVEGKLTLHDILMYKLQDPKYKKKIFQRNKG